MNNQFVPELEQAGLVIAGRDVETKLVEIVEIADHPFMMGAQFHPEFTSRPNRPNALFRDFIGAACAHAAEDSAQATASSSSIA
jgi:CTP synthase